MDTPEEVLATPSVKIEGVLWGIQVSVTTALIDEYEEESPSSSTLPAARSEARSGRQVPNTARRCERIGAHSAPPRAPHAPESPRMIAGLSALNTRRLGDGSDGLVLNHADRRLRTW